MDVEARPTRVGSGEAGCGHARRLPSVARPTHVRNHVICVPGLRSIVTRTSDPPATVESVQLDQPRTVTGDRRAVETSTRCSPFS